METETNNEYRIVKIGKRTTKDLTQKELLEFITSFGLCGSLEYFHPPVITFFEYDDAPQDKAIFFDYYQIRKDDGVKFENIAHISVTGKGNKGVNSSSYDCFLASTKHGSHWFKLKEINYFINLGFDMPIYNNENG